ncbi:hypothetical protein AgCh_030322 [Apium graveolens]
MVIFYKVFEDEHKVWGATIKIEGDYIWPLRLLRAVAYTEKAGESGYKDDYNISNPHYSIMIILLNELVQRCAVVVFGSICGILLGVILCTYEFPKFLPVITLVVHSYWIPQIATNVFRDPRKPLQPSYIIGMSVTRLAIPLYIFGCPRNFMHIKPDRSWCIYLVGFAGLQANILLLQHYLGCRFFIFWQILMQMFPLKYNYHKRPDQDVNHASDCVICMTPIDFTQHPDFCMMESQDREINFICLNYPSHFEQGKLELPKMFSDVHGDTISDVINIELGGGYRSKFKYCPRTCKIYGLRRFFGKYDIDENFVIFFKYLGNSTFAITVFDYQCMNHFRDIEKYFRFEDFMYPPVNDVVIIISDDENILQENNEMEMMIQAEGDDDVEEDHDALVPDQDNTFRVRLLLSLVDQRGHGVYIPRWMRTFYAKWGRRTTVSYP